MAAHNSLMTWNEVCVTACLAVTTILLALRSYVRLVIKPEWILEDHFCLLAWMTFVAYCVTMTIAFDQHGGVHEWDLTLPEVQRLSFLYNVTSVEYALAILTTKIAILLFYRRVFFHRRGSLMDSVTRFFLIILSLFYITTTFVKLWECVPRERIWDKSVPGVCINVAAVLNISGLINTGSDALILAIPVKTVWNLQLGRRKRAGVIAVFTIGLLPLAFSITGLVVRFNDSASPDNSYYNAKILLWAAAEISTGLCCVCLPTLPALRRSPVPFRHSSERLHTHTRNIPHGPSRHTARHLTAPGNGDWYALQAVNTSRVNTNTSPNEIVTNISGGADIHDLGTGNLGPANDSVDSVDEERGLQVLYTGIMMTIGIEQTFEGV